MLTRTITMKQIPILLSIGLFLLLTACNKKNKTSDTSLTFEEKLEQLPDSVKVDGIIVKNLFKNQILAHKGNQYDSLMIVNKVYKPHKELWDDCYGMIFGEENAAKFNTPVGMIKWNKTLYPENKDFFDKRVKELLKINLDSVLETNLNKFEKMVPYQPQAKISILFTPIQGIGFGGCDKDQFCFELNNKDYKVSYTIEKGLPHELNHLAYEPFRENDPKRNTALAQTIDEGFASFFTWIFFKGKITKYEAVENMTNEEWNWYIKNEKEIFEKSKKYFDDKSGDNPLLRNDKFHLFEEAPKSLNYWLGFRIVEKYVEKNGAESWKDIYTLNVQDVLEKSGYEQYINGLQ